VDPVTSIGYHDDLFFGGLGKHFLIGGVRVELTAPTHDMEG
jgi:hypothetical protein